VLFLLAATHDGLGFLQLVEYISVCIKSKYYRINHVNIMPFLSFIGFKMCLFIKNSKFD